MMKNAAQGASTIDEMLKLYQDLVETSTDLTWQCDMHGRFTYLNPAWETTFGYKLAEMRGRKFSDFQCADMARRDMHEFSRLIRGGSLSEYETVYLAKSGKDVRLLMNSKCIRDAAGDIIGTRGTAHDITTRKRIEEALRENEQNYRSLADSGQALIWVAGTDKLCTYFNHVWLKFTGRTIAQEMGNGWVDGVHADDVQRCMDVYVAAFDRREKFSMEYRLRRHDGEYRWLLDDGSPRFNSIGVFIGYIGHCLDITDRKRVEEEALVERNLLLTIINTIPDRVYVKDLQCRFLLNNTAHIKALGAHTQADVVGKTDHDFRKSKFADGFLADDRHVIQSGEALYNREEATIVSTGESGTILSSKVPFRDAKGEVIGLVGVSRDISRRKQIEEELKNSERALRQTEEKLKAIFLNAPFGIALTNSLTGCIEEANPRFAEIAGRSVAEITTIDWMQITHPDDVQADLDDMARMNAGSISGFSREKRYVRPDGSHVWINMTVTPIPVAEGDSPHHLCMIMDITEMRLAAAGLKQAERMDAIGQLAGDSAHDFNKVLGGIIGYADMSLGLVEKNSVFEKNLRKVLTASGKASHLDRPILAFSRHGIQEKSVASVRPIVKEALALLRASIPSSVILESDLQKNTKPVLADPQSLHEVLLNLAANAVHAMNNKGTLTVRLGAATLDHVQFGRSGEIAPGVYTVIEMADTGSGMDAATLAKAFEPFFTTKPVGEGIGMGLSVVLDVVQSHGGDILVESEVGSGTTFQIFLPAVNEIDEHHTEAKPSKGMESADS